MEKAPTNPKSSRSEPSQTEFVGAAYCRMVMSLRDPRRPSRRLPMRMRRVMPDPLASLEAWSRFTGADLADLTPAMRRAESFRLRVAISLCEPNDVCDWVIDRLARLEAA